MVSRLERPLFHRMQPAGGSSPTTTYAPEPRSPLVQSVERGSGRRRSSHLAPDRSIHQWKPKRFRDTIVLRKPLRPPPDPATPRLITLSFNNLSQPDLVRGYRTNIPAKTEARHVNCTPPTPATKRSSRDIRCSIPILPYVDLVCKPMPFPPFRG